jgi:hypothetical protein
VIERFYFQVCERRRELHRRQPGRVQDLVGVRVADTAEDAGIGQGAFERMVLAPQPFRETRKAGGQYFQPARIVLPEACGAAGNMNRRLPAGAGFGEDQRAAGKVERGEPDLVGNRCAAIAPAEPAGNHQVQDQEQLVAEIEHEALSQPAQVHDSPSFERRHRRLDRTNDERVAQAHALDRLVHDARAQGIQVQLDIGQLRHDISGCHNHRYNRAQEHG